MSPRIQTFWREGRREGENVWKNRDWRWIFSPAAVRIPITQNWDGRKVKVTPKAGAFPGDKAASCTGAAYIRSSLSYLGPKSATHSKASCKQKAPYCHATSSTMGPRNAKMKLVSISLAQNRCNPLLHSNLKSSPPVQPVLMCLY